MVKLIFKNFTTHSLIHLKFLMVVKTIESTAVTIVSDKLNEVISIFRTKRILNCLRAFNSTARP